MAWHTPTVDLLDATELDEIKKDNARAHTDLIYVLPSEFRKVTSRVRGRGTQRTQVSEQWRRVRG